MLVYEWNEIDNEIGQHEGIPQIGNTKADIAHLVGILARRVIKAPESGEPAPNWIWDELGASEAHGPDDWRDLCMYALKVNTTQSGVVFVDGVFGANFRCALAWHPTDGQQARLVLERWVANVWH